MWERPCTGTCTGRLFHTKAALRTWVTGIRISVHPLPLSRRSGTIYLGGAWGGDAAPTLNRPSSSVPQPIPGKQRRSCGAEAGPLSLPVESLLRPVRKVRWPGGC